MTPQLRVESVTSKSEDIKVVKSRIRAPMSPSRRAKQFAPFDALKGLKEAIAAKERHPEPRKELSEEMIAELSKTLSELRRGQQVTVVYYGSMEQEYLQLTGTVVKVDPYWKLLQVGNVGVDFNEIIQIEI